MLDLRKNLIERRMIELDPDLANHYLGFNTYETQRDIRVLHVAELSDKMKSGLFRFGEVAFAVLNGSRDLLLNGQHVCSAVIDSGVIIPCILERFKINNDRELSEAFRQFEILPRSLNDMVKVEAHSLRLNWPLRISSLIVSAATLEITPSKNMSVPGPGSASRTFGSFAMSKDLKVKLLGKYLKEGAFLSDILQGGDGGMKDSAHLRRAPVALIMFKTWRISSEDAHLFWARVRDGENLKKDMPEMKLREFLKGSSSLIGRRAYVRQAVTTHEYAYRCSIAWNAFRSKKPTRLTYYPDRLIPKLK